MKKLLSAILALAILAIPCSIPLTAMAATQPAADFVVAQTWPAADGENYWGPYDGFKIDSGAAVFDQSKDPSWGTVTFKDYGSDTTYKYMELEMKTDTDAGTSVQLSIGQTAQGQQNGKPLTEWLLADGSKGIVLTSTYQTFKIDLAANGTTQFLVSGKPSIAVNKLGNEKVYIKSIKLTDGTKTTVDSKPEESKPEESKPESVSSPEASKDYVVGDKWDANVKENYWGPYGGFELHPADGSLLWYADEKDSWGTMGFFWDTFDHTNGYKYLVVVAKTDDPAKCDVQMSIGQGADDKKVGKAFSDWTLADGKTGAKLTSDYRTYAIDVKASGVEKFMVQGQPDFAFNADKNLDYMISVDKIYLTNTIPKDAVTGGSTASTPAGTTSSQTGTSPQTGESSAMALPLAVTALCASGCIIFTLLARKKKEI